MDTRHMCKQTINVWKSYSYPLANIAVLKDENNFARGQF